MKKTSCIRMVLFALLALGWSRAVAAPRIEAVIPWSDSALARPTAQLGEQAAYPEHFLYIPTMKSWAIFQTIPARWVVAPRNGGDTAVVPASWNDPPAASAMFGTKSTDVFVFNSSDRTVYRQGLVVGGRLAPTQSVLRPEEFVERLVPTNAVTWLQVRCSGDRIASIIVLSGSAAICRVNATDLTSGPGGMYMVQLAGNGIEREVDPDGSLIILSVPEFEPGSRPTVRKVKPPRPEIDCLVGVGGHPARPRLFLAEANNLGYGDKLYAMGQGGEPAIEIEAKLPPGFDGKVMAGAPCLFSVLGDGEVVFAISTERGLVLVSDRAAAYGR